MVRHQILPEDIQVPSSTDFISVFGCDYSVDDDFLQQYLFQDNHDGKVRLTFGLVDGSFGLSFWQNNFEILKIYDEYLLDASIGEDDQSVLIRLMQEGQFQTIKLNIWPRIIISIVNMK